ncbi:MAG: EutN/CcmL family microcompartment protein [Pseudomonadota bacterium]
MNVGKVAGTVVATQKDDKLTGLKFLALEIMNFEFKPSGNMVVAVDSVGAGVGELVMYAAGSSARQTAVTEGKPVDAVIMAIIDEVTLSGEQVYKKDA